jgi:hypothetical protein
MALAIRDDFGTFNFAIFPLNHVIENPSMDILGSTILIEPYNRWEIKECSQIIGSCNGLLCLYGYTSAVGDDSKWFRIWNPATNTISKQLGYGTYNYKHIRTYTFVFYQRRNIKFGG